LGFVPDIETAKPLIYGWAGAGGPWIKPLTLRWISQVHCQYKGQIFIAGTNGAYDWRDIVMFIMSGAHIVEMCSAVMVYGYEWLGKQVQALEKFMDEKGYESVAEMWGVAADAAMAYADMPTCFYDGMQDQGGKVWVQEENCVGCGGCLSVCPVPGAIDFMIHQ
jgi:dihydroorotate dehydrogenase (fumarate)/dihydropyrimidine dehydrogenase (NAD+) subunit PreA